MISEIMNDYALANQKQWSHDRSQTVGASEIGQCARKVYWLKNENDPRYGVARNSDYVDTWGPRERGSSYEAHFWYPAMQAHFGSALLFAGPHQKTFVSGFLSATPDGMVWKPEAGECFMTECKTVDPRTNLTTAKDENVYQTHVQMGVVRELTNFQPTHSILSYTDASFWDEVKEFTIPFDEAIYKSAKERAAMIMTATDAADLKPEGFITGGRECDRCPFSDACGIARRSVPEHNATYDPEFAAEIAELTGEILLLEADHDAIGNDIRTRQDELKTRLREAGVKKIPGVVSWSSIKGRTSYNNKAIQEAAIAAGIDIEQFKTTGEASDRLTISLSVPEGGATQASA
jgi:hypothetical protein